MKELVYYFIFNTLFSWNVNAIELRKKIIIIDSGITYSKNILPYVCKDGLIDLTNTTRQDNSYHGTYMATKIIELMNKDKYCVVSIKFYDTELDNKEKTMKTFLKALYLAYSLNPSIINISAGGDEYSKEEFNIINTMLYYNIKIVVAAGNFKQNLNKNCNYYPACYNIKDDNLFIVTSVDKNGNIEPFANYNGPVNAKELGIEIVDNFKIVGTSISTAIKTGKLAK